MVAEGRNGVDDKGFKASGLRDVTPHGDLVDLMECVAVRRGETHDDTMRELSRFALQQRKREFRVWV